ncbi:hypothetical protein BDV25DRAFT_144040 [Aspergillus avenaceus]|uniref:Uncharacterized protein n=1 Tax=Aspergillus avenaceus TaxID=36643 RepID=A0A5N6TIB0_ASPAV|nr:hypothetical protein BDV25DRAFT_144040 [Aspergillus avenaceus]
MSLPAKGPYLRTKLRNGRIQNPERDDKAQRWNPITSQHDAFDACSASLSMRTGPIFSRIPTPTRSISTLYSHAGYKRENRRSALSAPGSQDVKLNMNVREGVNENPNNAGREKRISNENAAQWLEFQRRPFHLDVAPMHRLSDPYCLKTNEDTRLQRAITRSYPQQPQQDTPVTRLFPVPIAIKSKSRHSGKLPVARYATGSPSTRLSKSASLSTSRFEAGVHRKLKVDEYYEGIVTPISNDARGISFRKERVENHLVPTQTLRMYSQLTGSNQTRAPETEYNLGIPSEKMGYIRKGFRWTNSYASVKIENRTERSTERSTVSRPSNSTARCQSAARLSPLPDTRTAKPKDQSGRMLLSRSLSTGVRSKLKKPGLTAYVDFVSQVSGSQPQQYWLGRFVTLMNAFHYEDSFNKPDIATGFGMLSSYSRPLGHLDSNEADYRIKRAFMVLENVCMNEEASASLQQFRHAYVSKFGDRWTV